MFTVLRGISCTGFRCLLVQMAPAAVVAQMIRQVGSAMLHLHRRGVVHRDIRAANVLLCSEHPLKVKLCDLSLSAQLEATMMDALGHETYADHLLTDAKQAIRMCNSHSFYYDNFRL